MRATVIYRHFYIQDHGNKFEHSKEVTIPLKGFDFNAISHQTFASIESLLQSLEQVSEGVLHILDTVRCERSVTREGANWEGASLPKMNIVSQMFKEE